MIGSKKEAREACIELIDRLINFQKKNISGLEIMKEHINDMTTEQFDRFCSAFAYAMLPELLRTTLKANSAISATNATIEHIKEDK